MSFVDKLKFELEKSKNKVNIVFAEGWNPKIQKACSVLVKEKLVNPIVIYRTESEVNKKLKCDKIVIENDDLSVYEEVIYEQRKEKGLSLNDAKQLAKEPNYLMAAVVKAGHANGGICGIEYTTKDTLRAALQIVKAKSKESIVSSVMIMEKKQELLIWADCSLIIDPTAKELVNIADNAIDFTRKTLKIEKNNVAFLSFSTNGSGAGTSVDKVKEASQISMSKNHPKGTSVFGELQFDAAYVDEVRKKKAPNAKWKERANIFIFPNLDSGNIGYKIMQRCGHYSVTGPIIVGLDKQINDLSRGATLEEVISLGYITAFQTMN